MHAPGLPPQPGPRPTSGGVVTLRVLFTLLPILTCGFFAWGSMLRLALLTRRPRDWALMGLTAVLSVFWFVMFGLDQTEDTTGWQSDTGGFGTLVTGFAVCVYFLVADIRHHEAKAAAAAAAATWYPAQPAPYTPQQPAAPAYGYPPAAPTPVPGQARPVPPQAPAAPRIGQVRAELDELSELLRKQQDPNRRDTGHTSTQDPNQ